MPFVKYDVKKEIERHKKEDPELAKEYDAVSAEFSVIRQAIKLRKENGVTQPTIASITGMTQQSVSRMEKLGHSPSLRNFIRYLTASGLEMKIEKKALKNVNNQMVKKQ